MVIGACWRGACRICRRAVAGDDPLAQNLMEEAAASSTCHGQPQEPPVLVVGTSDAASSRDNFPNKQGCQARRDDRRSSGDGGLHMTAIPSEKMDKIVVSNLGLVTDFYDLERHIGTGAFSTVCRGKSKATGIEHAVKKILKSDLVKSSDDLQRLQREISITQVIKHEHIVRMVESFEDSTSIYLVLDLCSGGELFDRIVEAATCTESQGACLMKQICQTLCYIHEQGICHRDLKPEHVIFASRGPIHRTPLKIIDFGLSRRFKSGEVLTTAVGTPSFAAPEVFKQAYSSLCDVWSFGVIIYCLLSGCLPFDGATAKDLVKAVRKGRYSLDGCCWETVSDGAKDLIRKLLVKDPSERFTAEKALQHTWMLNQAPDKSDAVLGDHVLEGLKQLSIDNQNARERMLRVKSNS